MKKNLKILQKIVRSIFAPIKPLSIEVARHQPHSQGPLPFQNGGQTRRKTISYLTQAKSQLGTRNSKYSVFLHTFISLWYWHSIFPCSPTKFIDLR